MAKAVFITGITGLVGSHLAIELLQRGTTVHALRRKSSDIEPLKKIFAFYQVPHLFNQIEWCIGDLDDVWAIADGMKGCESVFHCAAVVSYHPRRKKEMILSNVEGTANVVNAAIDEGVQRFVHVSSVAALGAPHTDGTVDEQSKWINDKNTSGYAISKHFSEREVWRGFQEGLKGLILNPSIVMGPGYWNKSSAHIFQKVNDGLSFYGRGSSGFVDARDVAKALLLLEESALSQQRYTFVGEHLPFKVLFEKIAAALGTKAPTTEAKPWMGAIAWRLEYLRALITGKEPLITRETVHAVNKDTRYSAAKFHDTFSLKMTSIEEAIAHTANCFKKG